MDDNQIWKEIQNSMAIEGWVISDEELERIKTNYQKLGLEESLQKVIAEIGIDAPLELHKKVWKRIRKEISND